ncbi:isopenicillin N synthase family oxygenase [Azospirillum sp. RWY-5-1]|uniref:Isopenicillin N synthase family oxygenase n=1 Tax=Azospirillum oleiclasticum TaxID=2735135 RepID=A0ABX2T9Y7_9PROT|nr:isopenicillin N synthase family oxygenase [Azospirillum oleiclasticum]NYZ21152.1 isopenicillin N synthase family oxygenase [Azospirillum oleiclasticum]
MDDFTTIPVIDVSVLNSADAGERAACAARIGDACRSTGFFYVVGHGIDPAMLAGVYDAARAFFEQPLADKMAVALSRSPQFRGYFPLKGEVTDTAFGGDPKEGFDISLELPADAAAGPYHRLRGPNQWPEGVPGFRERLTDYYDALSDLGRTLSRGFALALDLPEGFFAAKLGAPTAILRILHYPPVDAVPDPAALPPFGCGAHTDYGYLTILAQDDSGGLQVQNRAGAWIDVPPLPGSYVCNIGEMMARWTDDSFRATPHRVVRVSPGSRYSIPFFFHPDPDVMIEPLPAAIGAAATFEPVTSGAWLLRRLEGAYA